MQDDDDRRDTLPRSVASLGIYGDALDPAEVSALLGCAPSIGGRKGERMGASRRRRARPIQRLTGAWVLRADERQPADFEGQIRELLDRLTPDLAVWASLAARFDIRIFFGVFLDHWNEELSLSASALALLAERGIRLDLDIYAPVSDDDDDPADEYAARLH